MNLAGSHCLRHPDRQAAARCPRCGKHFCRECVTEHGGRYLCIDCLNAHSSGKNDSSRMPLRRVAMEILGALAGGLILFCLFYLSGKILLSIPTHFHFEP